VQVHVVLRVAWKYSLSLLTVISATGSQQL
jgi:hypothetical protein